MLNDEQTYEICLDLVSRSYNAIEGDAGMFLTYYMVNKYPGIQDEEIHDKILDAIFHREAGKMVTNDMLTVDFAEDGEVKYTTGPEFYTAAYKELIEEIDTLVFSMEEKTSELKKCWERMDEKDRQNLMLDGYSDPADIIEQYDLE